MRIRPQILLVLLLTTNSPVWGLVLADSSASAPSTQLSKWESQLDTTAIVRVHTPFGTTASGVLLKGGTHILTAAHVTSCLQPSQIPNGLVDFPNAKGQRRHWKSIQLHPAGTTPARRKIWDAALIELDQPISREEVAGLEIAEQSLTLGQLIALTGFGETGSGTLGAFQRSDSFTLGFNHLDFQITPSQCPDFQLAKGNWPLWVHRFDSESPLGAQEAHFASGDSGGAGLVLDSKGRTRLATLNIARHRGDDDHDHRLNGSFGELGLSLDVQALLPWLKKSLPVNSEKQNETSKNH